MNVIVITWKDSRHASEFELKSTINSLSMMDKGKMLADLRLELDRRNGNDPRRQYLEMFSNES